MQIIINNSSMIPVYEQVMEQIKQQIIQGLLKEGDSLPSVRSLANELKISALTVKKSYDKLEEAGFVSTIHGKGTYVTKTDTQLAKEARLKTIEKAIEEVVHKAKLTGLTAQEIREILELFL